MTMAKIKSMEVKEILEKMKSNEVKEILERIEQNSIKMRLYVLLSAISLSLGILLWLVYIVHLMLVS